MAYWIAQRVGVDTALKTRNAGGLPGGHEREISTNRAAG